MVRINFKGKGEKSKIAVMAVLLACCCFMTYYFHIVLNTGTVFTHSFYIPIILASVWWKRKGLYVAVFLALWLIFSHFYIRESIENINDLLRAFMFIAISYVVAILSERIARANENIKKEKNFSENIITTVPDSLIVVDKNLRIKKANLSFYKIFGLEPEKMIGTRITDIVGDDDGKLSDELTRLLGTNTVTENFELHYRSEILGHRIFNIAARGIIVAEEAEEETEEVLVILEDITKRKHAEQKVRELNQAIEQSSEGIATADLKGRFVFVNQAWEEMHGYQATDLIGKPIVILDSPADKENLPKIWEQINKKGFWRGELQRVRKDGSSFPAIITSSLVKDNNDRPVCIIGTCINISESKKAEEVLQRFSEELKLKVEERTKELVKERDYTRNLLDSIPVAVSISDHDGRITDINRTLLQIFRYDSTEEFLKLPASAHYYDEKDRERFLELLETGSMENFEVRFKRKDGTLFWGSMFSIQQRTEENKIRFINSIQDITERKQAEEQLKKRLQELEIYYQATLGREGRIIELKQEINTLLERLGEKRKFVV